MNRRNCFRLVVAAAILPVLPAFAIEPPLEPGDWRIPPDCWTEDEWIENCGAVGEWYGVPLHCLRGTYLGQPPKTGFEQRKLFDARVWLAIANRHGIHSPRLIESVEELPRTRALLVAHGLPSHLMPRLPLRALLGR